MNTLLKKVFPTLLLAGLSPACKTTCLPPGPLHADIVKELDNPSIWKDPILASTPIIDVHVHTFNARYLPLRGVIEGKRDAGPPVTWLISDRCSAVIAADLCSRTVLAPYGGHSFARSMEMSTNGKGDFSIACAVFSSLINKGIQKGVWTSGMSSKAQLAALDKMAEEDLNLSERLAVRATGRMMGMEEHMDNADQMDGVKTILRYLWTLTQSDASLIDLYRNLHEGTQHAGDIKIVSHMMDLAPVYNQKPDGVNLIDFEKEQIPRTRAFTQQHTQGATYFVAYNPYRDYWNGGKPGDALRIVKEAVLKKGASGVKVYPPSGYRPAPAPAGSEPLAKFPSERPTPFFTRFPGKQWDARYGPLGKDADEKLYAELDALLSWCETNRVPVFTHCGHGELEARKGYGLAHANPVFWRGALQRHPDLRLCLGHAGGGDFWYGCGKLSSWGREVFELCATYPNVYCEVTSGTEVLDKHRRAYFVEKVSGLIAESQDKSKFAHDFSKKLLYGTDWPQPDAGDPKAVLQGVQLCFLHPKLHCYYADYFHRNAEAYLGRKL
ncbi:MAG: amidohydrolase family protein [Luteolibacter sp.]|uniref:amidohydrolase family protein n=1 Tax=Luteolibacter sp. TaxID=1962973 RepID=UPI0032637547